MKKLFVVAGTFFDNKKAAKEFRNSHKGECVSIGPDHWKYGVKGNPRTHSHNNRAGGHGNGFPRR